MNVGVVSVDNDGVAGADADAATTVVDKHP